MVESPQNGRERETRRIPIYAPDLQPLMQSLLSTLADFEVEHETDLSKLKASRMDPRLKAELRSRIEARHRERREPYLAELTRLEQRVRGLFA